MSADFRKSAPSKKEDLSRLEPSSFEGTQSGINEIKKHIETELNKKVRPELTKIIREKAEGVAEKSKEKIVEQLENYRDIDLNSSKEDAKRSNTYNQATLDQGEEAQNGKSDSNLKYSPLQQGTSGMHDSRLSDSENRTRKIEAIRSEAKEEAQKKTNENIKQTDKKMVKNEAKKMAKRAATNAAKKAATQVTKQAVAQAVRMIIVELTAIIVSAIVALGWWLVVIIVVIIVVVMYFIGN